MTRCSCAACPAAAVSCRSPRTRSCTTSPRAHGVKPPARCPPPPASSVVPGGRPPGIPPLTGGLPVPPYPPGPPNPPGARGRAAAERAGPRRAGNCRRDRHRDPLARVHGAAQDRRAPPVRPAVLRGRHRQPRSRPERARPALALGGAQARLEEAGRALATHSEIPFAAATTGPTNLVASAVFRDTQHLYEYLTGELAALPGVSSVQTAPIIGTLKRTGSVPHRLCRDSGPAVDVVEQLGQPADGRVRLGGLHTLGTSEFTMSTARMPALLAPWMSS